MSQTNAEKLVEEFVNAGEVRRKDAEKTVQSARRARSCRRPSTVIGHPGRGREAARSLRRSLDDVEDRIEDSRRQARSPADEGRAGRQPAQRAAATTAAGKQARGQEGRGQEGRLKKSGAQEGRAKKAPGSKKAAAKTSRHEERRPAAKASRRRPSRQSARSASPARRWLSGRRLRLDAEMVRRGLVVAPRRRRSVIDAERVLVNGAVADKSARLVASGDVLAGRRPAAALRRAVAARSSTLRWTRSASTSPGCECSTRVRPRAGSPTACCSAAPATWWRSTSVTASCIRTSAAISG